MYQCTHEAGVWEQPQVDAQLRLPAPSGNETRLETSLGELSPVCLTCAVRGHLILIIGPNCNTATVSALPPPTRFLISPSSCVRCFVSFPVAYIQFFDLYVIRSLLLMPLQRDNCIYTPKPIHVATIVNDGRQRFHMRRDDTYNVCAVENRRGSIIQKRFGDLNFPHRPCLSLLALY